MSMFKKFIHKFDHKDRKEEYSDDHDDEHDPHRLPRRTSAAANALDLAHPSQQGRLASAPPAPRVPAQPEDGPPPYSAQDAGAARAANWPQQQPQQQQQQQQGQPQRQQQAFYHGRPYDPAAPPPVAMTSQMQNAGAQLGMFGAMATHAAPVGAGIVDGAVAGNIIGQRVHQAQSHAYWRQRQAAYLAGDESAVVNTGVPMTAREARREERRRRRWERRRSWGM